MRRTSVVLLAQIAFWGFCFSVFTFFFARAQGNGCIFTVARDFCAAFPALTFTRLHLEFPFWVCVCVWSVYAECWSSSEAHNCLCLCLVHASSCLLLQLLPAFVSLCPWWGVQKGISNVKISAASVIMLHRRRTYAKQSQNCYANCSQLHGKCLPSPLTPTSTYTPPICGKVRPYI